MKIDDLNDAIHTHEKQGKPRDNHAIYVPKLAWNDLRDSFTQHRRVGDSPSYSGYEVIPDPFVTEPRILAENVSGLLPDDLFLENPPFHLLKQLFEVDLQPHTDPLRDTLTVPVRARVFLKPFCKWQRFDSGKVATYGHPLTTHGLDVIGADNYEYTKTDFDSSEVVKFGQDFVTTRNGITLNEESDMKETLCRRIYQTLHSVNSRPVTVERKRTIKGAYSVLDIEHTEQHYFGQRHTTYEAVAMVPYESVKPVSNFSNPETVRD